MCRGARRSIGIFNQTGWILGILSLVPVYLGGIVWAAFRYPALYKTRMEPAALPSCLFTAIILLITSISALLIETSSHVQRANGLVENFSKLSVARVAGDANLIRELVVVQAGGLVLIGVYALFVYTLSNILRYKDKTYAA